MHAGPPRQNRSSLISYLITTIESESRPSPPRFVVNEFEPVFDAADFVRCGRDLFVTRSNVTNRMGIEWLRRHLGSGFRIHELESRSRQPMHIDSTFMPLAPGKVLVNPEYLDVDTTPSYPQDLGCSRRAAARPG